MASTISGNRPGESPGISDGTPSSGRGRIGRFQRYTASNPCPICGGCDRDKRGQQQRCHGFASDDREYARCSREEHAGGAPFDHKSDCYVHKLKGECRCGKTHGVADVIQYPVQKSRAASKAGYAPKAIAQTYDYTDGTGTEVLFQAVRYMGKGFSQRRPRPGRPGEWINDLEGVPTVPYRLPDLVAAPPGAVVWIPEGEKDVDNLRALGLVATCNAMGAGKWTEEHARHCNGRDVVILQDNDKSGREHAEKVAATLKEVAKSVRVLDLARHMTPLGLPALPEKGDVSDFLAMGGTLDQLLQLATSTSDRFRKTYATLADAMKVIGDTRWFWERWIPAGCLSLLAAVAGGGKTRTAMDLARRLWSGLPFPDGSPNPYPAGTTTLWVMYDRNWAESADVTRNFGVPMEAIILPAEKDNPLATPDFDDPKTMVDLEDQIKAQRPGLVVIDTITYATNRNTSKAEEAKAAFDGLMDLAARTGVAVLALTHLNKEGEVLGRRITERARSVIFLSLPDKEGQPNRRKLWVEKTAVKPPDALGITFTDTESTYDNNPPEDVEASSSKPRGPAPAKSTKLAEWLWDQLSTGPRRIASLIEQARFDDLMPKPTSDKPKPSLSPLYNAKDRVGAIKPGWSIEEVEGGGPKTWRLVGPPIQNHDAEEDPIDDVDLDGWPVAKLIPADF